MTSTGKVQKSESEEVMTIRIPNEELRVRDKNILAKVNYRSLEPTGSFIPLTAGRAASWKVARDGADTVADGSWFHNLTDLG